MVPLSKPALSSNAGDADRSAPLRLRWTALMKLRIAVGSARAATACIGPAALPTGFSTHSSTGAWADASRWVKRSDGATRAVETSSLRI
jgi:hypothetical protein